MLDESITLAEVFRFTAWKDNKGLTKSAGKWYYMEYDMFPDIERKIANTDEELWEIFKRDGDNLIYY